MSDEKPIRILIIDDEFDIGMMITGFLEKRFPGSVVQHVDSGNEAEKILAGAPPDLVILDLMIPGTDSFKLCEKIKSDNRLRRTKVLVFTGQDTLENRNRIMQLGADDFLPKPFDVDDLIRRIASLLNISPKRQQ